MQSVYAFTPEEFIGNLDWNKMTDTEKWGCIFNFTVAEIGAVVNHDAASFIYGMTAMSDFMNNNDPDNYVKEEKITIPKDYVALVKQCIEEYAKEHEPYYMVNTLTLDDLAGSPYQGSKLMYDTAKNLLEDSPSGVIAFGAYYSHPVEMYFVDIGNDFRNVSPVKSYNQSVVNFYNNETWGLSTYTAYYVMLNADDDPIKTAEEFKEKATRTFSFGANFERPIGYLFKVYTLGETIITYPYDCRGQTNMLSLVTKEKRRIRVFNTYGDLQNYTLGKRSVYYTSKYYSYVPEDITVSIDELQKTIDDLQKVIDDLLERIIDRTDEEEIERLLREILEALKNQQGTGSGSGSGNVTVNVDMTQTNSWLAKIYTKIAQIYEKMNSAVENAEDAALAKIQESLDEIIVQLKKIKHWNAVDTVIDGVDAIADWLDLIKDVLKDAKEGAGSAVATIASSVGDSVDLMSKKFPFSIPWDILFFVSVLSAEPKVPHFEIPFNIELSALNITIDYDMELDFEQFQWLSDLSRLLLSMTYAVGLLKQTSRVTSAGKEE